MSEFKSIYAWDADSVEWATLTVDVSVNRTWDVTNSPQIDDSVPDAYVTTFKATGSFSHSYVFYREAPALDNFVQNTNAFAVVRGVMNGTGVTDPVYIGAPLIESGRARSVYSKISGAGGFSEVKFDDATQTFDVSWEINYEKVGPDNGGSIPTNQSGTVTLTVNLWLYIQQALNQIRWDAATVISGDIIPSYHASWPIIVDGGLSDEIQVFVHNLHTDPGDDIDFGANVSWSTGDPGAYWTINTWDVNGEVVTTCS